MISFDLKQNEYTYFDKSDSENRHDGFSGYTTTDPLHFYLYRYHHASEGYAIYSTHPPKQINQEAIFQHDII